MMPSTLGPITLLAPWVLGAVVVLPLIWLLLRLTPPAPRRQRFPALWLLKGLSGREEESAHTPPWLVALRVLAAVLALLALAHPVWQPAAAPAGGGAERAGRPLVLVVEEGWAAAPSWSALRAAADVALDRAILHDRPVILIPTAAPADGGPFPAASLSSGTAVRDRLRSLAPKPWPSDPEAALAAASLDRLTEGGADVLWFSDGLAVPPALLRRMQRLGSLTLFHPSAETAPVVFAPPQRESSGLSLTLHRPRDAAPRSVMVRALDARGHAIAGGVAEFGPGQGLADLLLPLPADLHGSVARLEAVTPEGQPLGAGAVWLLEDPWQRRPVGLIDTAGGRGGVPLLSPLYYLHRALDPLTELHSGPLNTLPHDRLSTLVLADGLIPQDHRAAVRHWVDRGGLLLRFAGPELASPAVGRGGDDGLLPAPVRSGSRSLGGSLSWSDPMALAPFPEDSPLFGLSVPADITVRSQVLIDPTATLEGPPLATWARLSDGTPLVSARRLGDGWVVLVHTTASPDWSNLPLSGLFPELLRRLIHLGQGVASREGQAVVTPLLVLDGLGRLDPPGPGVRPLPLDARATPASPAHPPGWYGPDDSRSARNLWPQPPALEALRDVPSGIPLRPLQAEEAERPHDLRPVLLAAALALVLVDGLISLALRGLVPRIGVGVLVVMLGSLSVISQGQAQGRAETPTFAEAVLETRLAYVLTGLSEVDRLSAQGLTGLTRELGRRTSAELALPHGVDVGREALHPYPLLYWPAAPGQRLPDAQGRLAVAHYLDHGGMILFDGRGSGLQQAEALRTLLSALDMPPLHRLPGDHVVTRSFYLLSGLPGRSDGGAVWIEPGDARPDGVASVIVGANDWAGAWAVEGGAVEGGAVEGGSGRAVLPMRSGGERGRELAFRAGINMVMYALTGNYKEDQVHIPAILERLTQ